MTSATPSKWGDLFVRSASAAILVPAVIACIWFGGNLFLFLVGLSACLIAYEWVAIVHPHNYLQYALHGAAALAGTLVTNYFGVLHAGSVVLGLAVLAGLLVRFGDGPKSIWSYLGIFYVGLPAMALVILRLDPVYVFAAILWLFLTVWAADILAYFSGRIIGGPKLAPKISPKKTWAGLAGAIIGSALASVLFAYFMNLKGAAALALLAGALAIVEQAGDLFESSLKRYFSVKDSGTLIPGHGGIIDRVDGLIAVAMIAALLGWYRGQGLSAAQGLLLW